MADGVSRQGAPPRPSAYPSSHNQKRDAAYLNIFGYTPPAGRSHTMTSQTPQYAAGRSRTMTSQNGESYPNYPPQQIPMHPTIPNPSPSAASVGSNGYNQSPYLHSNAAASASASPLNMPPQMPLPLSSQQIPPNQPQRQYPGRTQYPLPQRMDTWSPSQQLRPYPMYAPPPRGPASHAPSPVPPIPPALNSDPNRSRSLAAMSPASYHPTPPPPAPSGAPQSGYPPQQAPMMPAYRPPAPPSQAASHPAYRASPVNMIPDTPESERAMSMSFGVRQAMGAGRMAQARRMDPQPFNVATPTSMERPSFEKLQFQQVSPLDASPSIVASPQNFPTMNDSSSQPPVYQADSNTSAFEPRARYPSDGTGSLKSDNSKPSTSIPPENASSGIIPDSGRPNTGLNQSPVQEQPRKTLVTHRSSTAQDSTSSGGIIGSSFSSRRSKNSGAIPIVYPAFSSRMAEAFQEMMLTTFLVKGDSIFPDSFTGADAIDLLCTILRTRDRKQGLVAGRALVEQKFFVDVSGGCKLRDTREEVYQFSDNTTPPAQQVNSVSTALTECYSPTCSRQRLCYSVTCPRRSAQQRHLQQSQPSAVVNSSASKADMHTVDEDPDQQKLWSNSVPKEVVENTPDREKKRQEVIFEVMYTERDFVKDLEYLRDFWMKPLHSGTPNQLSPISEHRREKFIRTVFGNCLEVLKVSSRFSEALNARQKESHAVKQVGDIFCQFAPQFTPFIKYGSNQIFGKSKFEKEKVTNPAFATFVEDTERLKESRKLDLNGYLTKPTTRLARYPLFLENILKYTSDDNPDKKDLVTALARIREVLARVNAESGKAENHFNLVQLNDMLRFPPGEQVDLCLTDEHRTIIIKIQLKKSPTDNSEVTAYLLDHALLLVRSKKKEECYVYRKPIPLELLSISAQDEAASKGPLPRRAVAATPGTATNLPINIRHLGKGGYDITLYASPPTAGRRFMSLVDEHQTKQRERYGDLYTKKTLITKFFLSNTSTRVNCVVPIDFGRKLVVGTDSGIYLSDLTSSNKPRKVLDANYVTQIDIVEELQILLILANKNLMYYPVKPLQADDIGSSSSLSRPKKAQVHANFFKVDNHFVYTVKTTSSSTTLRMFEPLESKFFETTRKLSGKGFFGSDPGDNLNFRMRCEATVPHETYSLHVLKQSKSMTVCLGGARGFEVVNVATGKWEPLLNLGDTSLDVINRRETVRPIRFDRVHDGLFLTHYSECSLFINASGWREKRDWEILWEGTPNAFAFCNPYILAFDPNFIEIRHVDSNDFVHVITGRNLRLLHSSGHEVTYAYEDEGGDDVIAMLTFDKTSTPSQVAN